MKEETVAAALEQMPGAGPPFTDAEKVNAALIVWRFLTGLLDGANWIESVVIRTVRGYVTKYLRARGASV
jgi:hypothetical protein